MRLAVQEFEDRIGLRKGARAKALGLRSAQTLLRWTHTRMRRALGGVPRELPEQYELRALAAPWFHSRLNGGEGDMLVGKALWAHRHKKAHMICELSPYSCMPNTMSVGAMAGGIGKHPDLLYAPIEVKGDAEVLAFLARIEAECGFAAGRDRIFVTGSSGTMIAPLVGGKFVQEVVSVAAAVEKLHPDVYFVSEIGGEDMKTLFFTPAGDGRSKQVFMQSACSGGTGTFIEKTARKLHVTSEALAQMPYAGMDLHKISSKCGIFAEADSNTLVKSGVPVEEIIASLFEAVVYQNLATLTKGNTPVPRVLLLGGPNPFFRGLRGASVHHLGQRF